MNVEDKCCLEEELTESRNVSRQRFKGFKDVKGKSRIKGLKGHKGFTKVGTQRPC